MATQASPGLNTPSPYQALPGVPPNMSAAAAVSAGLLPTNVMLGAQADVGLQPLGGNQTPSLLSEMSEAGANGTSNFGQNANMGTPSTGPAGQPANGGNPGANGELTINAPASSVTLATQGGQNQFCG